MTVKELIAKLGMFDGDLIVATLDDNEMCDVQSDPVVVLRHPDNAYLWDEADSPRLEPALTERRLLL